MLDMGVSQVGVRDTKAGPDGYTYVDCVADAAFSHFRFALIATL